ncbi:PhzF family phenazine biosynthesis protein [Streptacidiphilus melanogenes]|uniref:PhzF family phenazine biosynthesis protein n=1 Tax=Streptacidiphilus melanogenes TaxID=411235 RepID=UPI0005A6649F|nr:PhzF family phenazine biosynthesis protein [Streptacidiphilus melanogenes]
MSDLHVLRVFCGPGGAAGNALGVVTDGSAFAGREQRQQLARELGFSETVFVDDAAAGRVDIYTPSARLPFAGHPLVGTSWLLRSEGFTVDMLRPEAGDVAAWQEGEFHWIRGRAQWASGRRTQRYDSVAEVDALAVPPLGTGWLYAWAWSDEAEGAVRTRGFPGRGDGIDEDEATGAAAVVLTAELGRALDIRQGVGSQILTRPGPDGTVEVGGRVVPVEVRRLRRA